MVEHGKCASGSSKGRGGAYAIVLDAMGFLQKCTLPSVRVIEARRDRDYPEPAKFLNGPGSIRDSNLPRGNLYPNCWAKTLLKKPSAARLATQPVMGAFRPAGPQYHFFW